MLALLYGTATALLTYAVGSRPARVPPLRP